ncbi:MAG: phospholipase D-like domain-containing protein [Halanaeroarchaeum sp.]
MLARVFLALAVAVHGGPALVGVVPNPATDGDVGEYVLVHVDDPTNLGGYALDDGEDVVSLPNETVEGTVAITDDPRVARGVANRPTVVVPEMLSLSNGGETVRLRRDERTLDSITYGTAPEAERYRNGTWTPLGTTAFPVVERSDVPVEAFALPDDPDRPMATIRSADRRLLLAGYTVTSPAVADALIAAARRGVAVSVLVEGGPVGGTPAPQLDVLERLTDAGVRVVASGGPRARYDYHHAKYLVADDAVLVTSENWEPSGIGGRGSRGWGVRVDDPALAAHLASVFAADAGWVDARPWRSLDHEGQAEGLTNDTYPRRFGPTASTADDVAVLLAPDNAESRLVDLLDGANESIRVEQVSVDPEGPLLAAAIRAARRGVRVRLLLSGAWYVEADNRALVRTVSALAEREALPIAARLVEPRSRFDHVHVKGVVVDERRTVVGSINWNRHALRENREVAVVVEDPAVGAYYARLFRADWRGAAWRVHWLTVAGLAVAMVVAGFAARRIEFEG